MSHWVQIDGTELRCVEMFQLRSGLNKYVCNLSTRSILDHAYSDLDLLQLFCKENKSKLGFRSAILKNRAATVNDCTREILLLRKLCAKTSGPLILDEGNNSRSDHLLTQLFSQKNGNIVLVSKSKHTFAHPPVLATENDARLPKPFCVISTNSDKKVPSLPKYLKILTFHV